MTKVSARFLKGNPTLLTSGQTWDGTDTQDDHRIWDRLRGHSVWDEGEVALAEGEAASPRLPLLARWTSHKAGISLSPQGTPEHRFCIPFSDHVGHTALGGCARHPSSPRVAELGLRYVSCSVSLSLLYETKSGGQGTGVVCRWLNRCLGGILQALPPPQLPADVCPGRQQMRTHCPGPATLERDPGVPSSWPFPGPALSGAGIWAVN